MLKLALPISLGFLGLMLMGFVDLLFLGRLGPEAVAAAGLTNALFSLFLVVGIGALSGTEFLVSFFTGASQDGKAREVYIQANWFALIYSLPLTIILIAGSNLAILGSSDPGVQELAPPMLTLFALSLLPALQFAVSRQYLQSRGHALPGMMVLVVANILNICGNLLLIPRWGALGSAYSTLFCRIFMAGALLAYLIWVDREFLKIRLAPKMAMLRELVKLGLPSGAQMGLEVGIFALATVAAGRMGAVVATAHQAALNTASLTFMIPLGISSATTVLVGQSLGRHDLGALRKAGKLGFWFAAVFMMASCLLMLTIPEQIVGIYTQDPRVIAIGSMVLRVAGVFQLFDGIQIVGSGAHRGLGNPRISMVWNLIGHWFIALPIGYVLGFAWPLSEPIVGVWIGLSVGLAVVAVALLGLWLRRTRMLASGF